MLLSQLPHVASHHRPCSYANLCLYGTNFTTRTGDFKMPERCSRRINSVLNNARGSPDKTISLVCVFCCNSTASNKHIENAAMAPETKDSHSLAPWLLAAKSPLWHALLDCHGPDDMRSTGRACGALRYLVSRLNTTCSLFIDAISRSDETISSYETRFRYMQFLIPFPFEARRDMILS
ncbi:hypothetical protein BJX70DRAFT_68126 [Aspergillus crustosus]